MDVELKLRLLSTTGNTRPLSEEPLENTMPSASPLYNFSGINNEIDCPYRIPSIEAQNDTRYSSNNYDSLQSLSAMADQSFNGIFSPNSPSYSSHIPVTSYSSSTQSITSSPSPYFTTSEYNCMYNTNLPNQRRSCEGSSNDSPFQTVLSKKGFHDSRDDVFNEQDQLLSWTRKHPENWSSEEVLDWLIYTGQEKGLNMSELRAEAFQNLCGIELCRLSIEEFINLEPKYGKSLYEMLKHLLTGLSFQKPVDITADYQELSPYNNGNNNPTPSPVRSHFGSPAYHTMTNRKQEHSNYNGYNNNTDVYWKTERQEPMPCDVIDIGPYDFDVNDHPAVPQPTVDPCSPEFDAFMSGYPNTAPVRTACCFPGSTYPQALPRRRPGRPRNKSLPGDEESRPHKDKKAKNQHLWEFIYDCLINPAYNPQFLRWENQREGVFRFVQSEAVAQLWGGFKNNENMTYEKLSRAMRHYYKRGLLERVEGRRLVYKFSRKALDRAREKRHITL
ncbi:hypothetical protein SNE40_003238 [Patella caerulea]|uniref:Uncharacterized protein n=2 Tax=Patella caerulea TaxID=87958 RepID=A0AAN8K2L2_PATCE